ncbi:MAG TPA: TolC family protein [Burkholderiaceae bacterium]|nr:TolC family protein [Burkholderiaceae bacterium]
MKAVALLSVAAAAALASQPAAALGLFEAWQAAQRNDREFAVARAAHEAAQPRLNQGAALWRPEVLLSAAAGLGTNENEARGAQFSTPAFGRSNDVAFDTSVTNGTVHRWTVSARQPLYNPARRSQQQELLLSVDLAGVEWQAAVQSLRLRTAERYFGLAVAAETLRVLRAQSEAIGRATTEAQDRYRMGAAPVTDTHEAKARLAAATAQVLAAQRSLQLARTALSDSTGIPVASIAARLPGPRTMGASMPLVQWLERSAQGNPAIASQAMRVELAKQEAVRHSARAATSVDLVAQAGRERLSGSGDFGSARNSSRNELIGVQVTVPLYTGGLRDAKHEEALRRVEQARAELQRIGEQVAQQTHSAWLGLEVGVARVAALEDALEASEARLDMTQLGVEIGDRTTLDRLNAENETTSARLALVEARVTLLMDRLRLAALAGQLDDSAMQSVDAELARREGN